MACDLSLTHLTHRQLRIDWTRVFAERVLPARCWPLSHRTRLPSIAGSAIDVEIPLLAACSIAAVSGRMNLVGRAAVPAAGVVAVVAAAQFLDSFVAAALPAAAAFGLLGRAAAARPDIAIGAVAAADNRRRGRNTLLKSRTVRIGISIAVLVVVVQRIGGSSP